MTNIAILVDTIATNSFMTHESAQGLNLAVEETALMM